MDGYLHRQRHRADRMLDARRFDERDALEASRSAAKRPAACADPRRKRPPSRRAVAASARLLLPGALSVGE
jgi:hypothetical protein